MKAKRKAGTEEKPLAGKSLAMVFDKPSTRTRVSFDLAMRQLGGETIMLTGAEMQLGRGESIADTARVLSRFVDAIMIRILSHVDLLELAKFATVPVITAHPRVPSLPGDGRRAHLRGAQGQHPGPQRGLDRRRQQRARLVGPCGGAVRLLHQCRDAQGAVSASGAEGVRQAHAGKVRFMRDPEEAVEGVDCVITDTWVSMGDKEAERRHNLLKPYQVNAKLMARAAPTPYSCIACPPIAARR